MDYPIIRIKLGSNLGAILVIRDIIQIRRISTLSHAHQVNDKISRLVKFLQTGFVYAHAICMSINIYP